MRENWENPPGKLGEPPGEKGENGLGKPEHGGLR